jgi:hypothetical protein
VNYLKVTVNAGGILTAHIRGRRRSAYVYTFDDRDPSQANLAYARASAVQERWLKRGVAAKISVWRRGAFQDLPQIAEDSAVKPEPALRFLGGLQ